MFAQMSPDPLIGVPFAPTLMIRITWSCAPAT
jgi:hypothetical protein